MLTGLANLRLGPQARQHFADHQDAKAALKLFPLWMASERSVLEGFVKHGPTVSHSIPCATLLPRPRATPGGDDECVANATLLRLVRCCRALSLDELAVGYRIL